MTQFKDLLSRLNGSPKEAAAPGGAPAGAADEAPLDWAALYMDALKLEGYDPTVDSDGDIRFKHERWTLCLMRDKRDAEFFRLALPNFWALPDAKERARAERAADRVNRRMKGAKLHSGAGDNMWVTLEMFVADHRQVRPVLMRCVRLLPEAALLFQAVMTVDG